MVENNISLNPDHQETLSEYILPIYDFQAMETSAIAHIRRKVIMEIFCKNEGDFTDEETQTLLTKLRSIAKNPQKVT